MGNSEYTIRPGTVEDLPAVVPMWVELYRVEKQSGMAYALREDAATIWEAEARRRIGTPNFLLFVAVDGAGLVAGFHTAQVRKRPQIYRETLVGSLTEVFVADAHRGQGLASRMIRAAVEEFRRRGLAFVEGQVVVGNTPPQKMYLGMGWTKDLIQFRLDLGGRP